eukprot:6353673-Pyramimonas_sp.AAC.1
MTSFYGTFCANNGKGALNTSETLPGCRTQHPRDPSPFLTALSSYPLSPTSLPFGPASITRKSVCLAVLRRIYTSCSSSLVLFNPTAAAVPSSIALSVLVLLTLAPLSSGLLARLHPLFPPPRLPLVFGYLPIQLAGLFEREGSALQPVDSFYTRSVLFHTTVRGVDSALERADSPSEGWIQR